MAPRCAPLALLLLALVAAPLAAAPDDPASAAASGDAGMPSTMTLADAGPWSLGLQAGYQWGFNSANYGHRYDVSNTAGTLSNGFSYGVGAGFNAGLEAQLRVSLGLALGLYSTVLPTDTASSTALYEGATVTTEDTRVRHTAVPVIAMAHTRAHLGPAVSIGTSFGVGAVFSQPYTEENVQVVRTPVSTRTMVSSYSRSLGTGMGLRGGLDASARLSRHCWLSLNADLFVASLPPSSASYHDTVTNASGAVVATHDVAVSYSEQPPTALQTAQPAVSVAGATVTTTYDDNVTQYSDVASPGHDAYQQASTLSVSSDNITYKTLALEAALHWEF